MYKIFRPILFLFPPETIHNLIVRLLKIVRYLPGIPFIISKIFTVNNKRLEREVFGLKFKNPVGLAAGFDKNAEVYNELGLFGFGFIEIGTVTPLAQNGNTKPRCFRLTQDKAILNRMGFNNKGADLAAENLAKKRKKGLIVGGNIGKNTLTDNNNAANDYLNDFKTLYNYVDYFVVNVSCPNVTDLRKLQDTDSLTQILIALINYRSSREEFKPVLLKISPDLTKEQIDETLRIIKEVELDGIVATNTTTSRVGTKTSWEKVDKLGNGGISGGYLTDKSLEIVRYISQQTQGNLPIIGVGGIMTAQDAVNMLHAGASLVQIYSGFIYEGPGFVKRINKKILKSRNVKS